MKKEDIFRVQEIFNKNKNKDLKEIKNILLDEFNVSYGYFTPGDLRKALILQESPAIVFQKNENKFIVGFQKNYLLSDKMEKITLQKAEETLAIIVDNKQENEIVNNFDNFFILGKNNWDEIIEFQRVFVDLKIDLPWLPPHSAIINFLIPTPGQIENKIVSELDGININIYDKDNYIDNIIHEIGHLFYRDCLTYDEKENVKQHFENTSENALCNFNWEKSSCEEYFCTLYKWYVKSILLDKAFLNILKFEDIKGFELIDSIIKRIVSDRINEDVWNDNFDNIKKYFNPYFDKISGKFIMKKTRNGFDIDDIVLPRKYLTNDYVKNFSNGCTKVKLDNVVIPINNGKLHKNLTVNMEKASSKPIVYVDMDGVVADFSEKYYRMFGKKAEKSQPNEVWKNCSNYPDFFRDLKPIDKGIKMVKDLSKFAEVKFLTTPMISVRNCRNDKIEWIKDHFGNNFDVIFSSSKDDYVENDHSILIDDMKHNLDAFNQKGGTAFNFLKEKNIVGKVKDVLGLNEEKFNIVQAIKNTDINPTEAQKESGNYKKGKFNWKGLTVAIENPKGSMRFGIGRNGKKWFNRLNNHYGYIKSTMGNDGDQVDCFLGNKLNRNTIYIINQKNPSTGIFDEHKCMIGFKDEDTAKQAYLSNYNDNWKGLDSIHKVTLKQFKEWLKSGNTKNPY